MHTKKGAKVSLKVSFNLISWIIKTLQTDSAGIAVKYVFLKIVEVEEVNLQFK